jgi:hypothetical protein
MVTKIEPRHGSRSHAFLTTFQGRDFSTAPRIVEATNRNKRIRMRDNYVDAGRALLALVLLALLAGLYRLA